MRTAERDRSSRGNAAVGVSKGGAAPALTAPEPAGFPAVIEAVEELVDGVIRITGIHMDGQHGIFHGIPRPGAADEFDRAAREIRTQGFRAALLDAGGGEVAVVVSPRSPAADRSAQNGSRRQGLQPKRGTASCPGASDQGAGAAAVGLLLADQQLALSRGGSPRS